jgi:hypothetical protein
MIDERTATWRLAEDLKNWQELGGFELQFGCKIFISKIVYLPIPLSDSIIKRIARVVPVLNGRDSHGIPKYLGSETTKIHRYLLVLWEAKSSSTLRLTAKGAFGDQYDS